MADEPPSDEWRVALSKLEEPLARKDQKAFLDVVKEMVVFSLHMQVRQSLKEHHIHLLKDICTQSMKEFSTGSEREHTCVESLIPILKLLRNSCAGLSNNQTIIGNEGFVSDIIDMMKTYIRAELVTARTPDELLVLKLCIQLLGNCCVNNEASQVIIWKLLINPDTIRLLLLDVDSDVVNFSCMIVHACLKGNLERKEQFIHFIVEDQKTNANSSVVDYLFSLKSAPNHEWILIVMKELLLLHKSSLRNLFQDFISDSSRIALLEFIFTTGEENDSSFFYNVNFAESYIELLVTEFKKSVSKFSENSSSILSPSGQKCAERPSNFLVKSLTLLCQCSCNMSLLKLLQSYLVLMESITELLKCFSDFDGTTSSAGNVSNLSQKGTKANVVSPLFHGVKRDLVQLLGNMCFKCKGNQDFMTDHVLLLLNQCGIDHANPYITQWAVWAIRNICEDHQLNQFTISQLECRGSSNLEEIERNFGCEVEIDEFGKLKMKKR